MRSALGAQRQRLAMLEGDVESRRASTGCGPPPRRRKKENSGSDLMLSGCGRGRKEKEAMAGVTVRAV